MDRRVQHLEFVLQQMHTALMALTRYEPNDLVANSRKNPLEAWRRRQKRYDPTTRGRTRNLQRTIISPGRCSLLELQAGIERWESHVSRYEKKLKDKLDDEIKLAILGALVPAELEKHLMLNSNRLRTFEGARLDIMTYVEAKIGSMIRDSKPCDTGSPGHSDAVNSLSSGKGKGSSSRVMGVLSVVEHIFNETARKSKRKQSSGKGKQSKSWSKSEGKGNSKEINGKSKGKPKGTKGANQSARGSHKGKTSKTGLSGLENSKSEISSETQESAQTCPTDNSWIHDAWSPDEWNDGWSCDEWNDDWSSAAWNKRMAIPQAHFHLEVLILVS